jgi:hypothetical protein
MKRYWSGVVAAGVVAATAAIGAQVQAPATTPPADAGSRPGVQRTPLEPGQTRAANSITITGCIQNAPTATAQAAPAARTGTYVLANASMGANGRSPNNRGGAVGTAGSTSTTYRLDGDTTSIAAHLNHQVRVTGTVQNSAASATGSANAAPGSTASGPTLRVDTVEMIADACAATTATPRDTPATGVPDAITPPDDSARPRDAQPQGNRPPRQEP